jgi:hypothetical protein
VLRWDSFLVWSRIVEEFLVVRLPTDIVDVDAACSVVDFPDQPIARIREPTAIDTWIAT